MNSGDVSVSTICGEEAKMTVIGRVGIRAKPAKNHPEFKEWDTANVVALVAANDQEYRLMDERLW